MTVQGPVKKQQPDGMSHRGEHQGVPGVAAPKVADAAHLLPLDRGAITSDRGLQATVVVTARPTAPQRFPAPRPPPQQPLPKPGRSPVPALQDIPPCGPSHAHAAARPVPQGQGWTEG